MTRSDRAFVLDAARVLGVALVVFVHYVQHYYLPIGAAFGVPGLYQVTLGGVGVTILLVVSGAGLEFSRGEHPLAWSAYLRRRLLRIYPTYWMAVLLALIFLGRPGHGLSPTTWALDLSGFLTFTGRPWGDYALPTGWFIGLVMALYLLYPAVSESMRTRPRIALGALFVVSLVSRVLLGWLFPDGRALDWFPLCRVFEFGLGVWLAAAPARRVALAAWFPYVGSRTRSAVATVGALSYPVFLVHYIPLNAEAFAIEPPALFVVATLAATLAASSLVLHADRLLQRALPEGWRRVPGRRNSGAVR